MVHIRPASIEDAPALAQLEKQIFPVDAWPAADIEGMMSVPYVYGFVAEIESEPVGYAILQGAPKAVADILTIGIVPEHRRKGGAEKLLFAMFKAAANIDVESVYLEVRESNKPAQAFYKKFGGQDVGRRPGYYRAQEGSPTEDAIVFQFVVAERVRG